MCVPLACLVRRVSPQHLIGQFMKTCMSLILIRFECESWNSNLKWFLFKVCMKNFGHSNVKFAKLIFIENNSYEYTVCLFMKGQDRSVVKFVAKLIQQQVSISSLIKFIIWFVWIFRFLTKMNFWIDIDWAKSISKLAKMPFIKVVL